MHWAVTICSHPLTMATTSRTRDTLGGDIKSKMWERTEGQGANRGEEEDVEKRRKEAKQGAEQEYTLESRIVFPPRSGPVLAKSFSVFNEFWLPSPCRPRRRWNISKSRREGAVRGAWK